MRGVDHTLFLRYRCTTILIAATNIERRFPKGASTRKKLFLFDQVWMIILGGSLPFFNSRFWMIILGGSLPFFNSHVSHEHLLNFRKGGRGSSVSFHLSGLPHLTSSNFLAVLVQSLRTAISLISLLFLISTNLLTCGLSMWFTLALSYLYARGGRFPLLTEHLSALCFIRILCFFILHCSTDQFSPSPLSPSPLSLSLSSLTLSHSLFLSHSLSISSLFLSTLESRKIQSCITVEKTFPPNQLG